MEDMEHPFGESGAEWYGSFPRNGIAMRARPDLGHNLSESTAQDLCLGEILDAMDIECLRDLPLGYGPAQGTAVFRQAVGQVCGVPQEHVLSTQGATAALALVACELCRPGDDAVLISPCFAPAHDTLSARDARVREVRLTFDEAYRLDPERVIEALAPTTRLVSLASPQNPSGARVHPTALLQIAVAMRERSPDAWMLVDETYHEVTYGVTSPPPSAAGLHSRIVTCSSVSKAYGAPGLRVGWITTADAGLRERLTAAKMNLAGAGSSLDEALAAVILARPALFLRPRTQRLAEALADVAAWASTETGRLEWVRPDGGALCCLRLRPDVFDDAALDRFWDALPSLGVALAPGTWFRESRRVFRIGFGFLPSERLLPALATVSRAMDMCVAPAVSSRVAASRILLAGICP